ncbi:MAG: tRNA (adenosine(37)-N6)-threonylcarbamoyltransferase complex transferase subunit TsaD [Candidatus Omnitrophica bacterium]|nr:tRNA (adenosine(37)-N6)-threonylcarbamoyltransferase complex transferase subunit TsaD [Candidatus Omnitrophota bacterium]
MNVLGIETSCDETAAAVVENGTRIRSSVVSSSLPLHARYGGIIPEIAFRKQLEALPGVADCALRRAGISLEDISLVSVTEGPGLAGALLVGVSFARAVACSRSLPLVGVNHLHGHIFSALLDAPAPRFPFVSLVVSGGHTSLYFVKGFKNMELLGSTRDDACGEAFDKVARILGLGYPGGPAIEQRARSGRPGAVKFRCSNTADPFDFSFSGIKTAVLYHVKRCRRLSPKDVADICASFQDACMETLVGKSFCAAAARKTDTIVVGGGVAANETLRRRFMEQAKVAAMRVLFPRREHCMDNAAMVAGLGFWLRK